MSVQGFFPDNRGFVELPDMALQKNFFPRQVVEAGGNRWDWALLPLVLGLLALIARTSPTW